MNRWFPIPAALDVVLSVFALGSTRAGGPGLRWGSAVGATLAIHAGVLAWGLGWSGRRIDGGPEWVQVQEAKHRRKGAWFARWGLAGLGLGWLGSRGLSPGPGAWFVACFNLGFQPAIFLAEWATIAAGARLVRSTAAGRESG